MVYARLIITWELLTELVCSGHAAHAHIQSGRTRSQMWSNTVQSVVLVAAAEGLATARYTLQQPGEDTMNKTVNDRSLHRKVTSHIQNMAGSRFSYNTNENSFPRLTFSCLSIHTRHNRQSVSPRYTCYLLLSYSISYPITCFFPCFKMRVWRVFYSFFFFFAWPFVHVFILPFLIHAA